MADTHISSFPIANLLSALGARPGRCKNTYHSPFRIDTNASLHIDPNRNIWFDHGAGIGGGNIDLVMKCRRCSAREAAKFILSLKQAGETSSSISNEERLRYSTKPEVTKTLTSSILIVRELRSPFLLEYFKSRGIPEAVASKYCLEVTMRGKNCGRSYDNIGFRNNNGGFALKAPSGFKSTTKAGITTIDMQGTFTEQPISRTVSVFEGFFDFLSWLAKENREVPSTDVIVLNSVSNVSRAFPYMRLHDTIICYLDNDDAGRAALETIRSFRKARKSLAIIDGSLFYYGYKDLNEWWIAMINRPGFKP